MELSSVPVESQVLRRLDGDLRLEHGRPVPGHIFVLSAGIVDDPKKKVPPSWRWRKRAKKNPWFSHVWKKGWCIPCCVRTKRCLCIKLWVWSQTVLISVLWLLEHGADLETDQKDSCFILCHLFNVPNWEWNQNCKVEKVSFWHVKLHQVYANQSPPGPAEVGGTQWKPGGQQIEQLCSSFMFLFSVHKFNVVGITFDFLFFCWTGWRFRRV